MTQYEFLLNEYNRLPTVIKQREERILKYYAEYLDAKENSNKDMMHYKKCELESENTSLKHNKARLKELHEILFGDIRLGARANKSVSEDDLNPSRFLCDKVWNRRSNR